MKINSTGNVVASENPFGKKDSLPEQTPKKPETSLGNDYITINSKKSPIAFGSSNEVKPIKNDNVLTERKDDEKNPWKVKSVHFNYGYVADNDVIHTGPMRIVNPENGTDVTITGYKQIDRKNWENLTMAGGSRFAPDEPQFIMGFNATFENNFGIELDGKHNKIIMDGYDQIVHFNGMMNGQQVDMDAPLSTFVQKHENTYGNMQISALGTYTFDLPAPGNHKFSFITKAGPSVITTTTHARLVNPSGEIDNGTSKIALSGYGGTVENGIRYQFGPKMKGLGLELTHSLSYLNYSNYQMAGGHTANHSAMYNSFALKATVNIFGNK